MIRSLLEAGRITGTHGLRGEVRAESWCDTPQDMCKLKRLYIGETEYAVAAARVQGHMVLLKLKGVDTIEDAEALKGKTVKAARADMKLSPGSYFITDCENAAVVDADSGEMIGKVTNILFYPGRNILEVAAADRQLLIPMVSEFIKEVDAENATVRVHLIDGM